MNHSENSSAPSQAGYLRESVRPLVCLAFVVPMLVAYEIGVIVLGPQAIRNGADVWLRHLLQWLGFGQYFLLPLLTCGILLGWHHTRREPWSFRKGVLVGMLLESLLFALVLLAIARLQSAAFAALQDTATSEAAIPASALPESAPRLVERLVAYFGAGIYEELLFRLMLLPTLAGLCLAIGMTRKTSLILAVALSSLVFSGAHYQIVTALGEQFDWLSFSFRFLAGVFFALVFVWRGFGIAAGSHALYDVLTVVA